jgi:MoaA/NifB/PqqE/SkfB family radical SAM enzyme
MGAPIPWPTRWPEPQVPPDLDDPEKEPAYDPDEEPFEQPYRLPEDHLAVTWGVTHACNLRCSTCYDVVNDQRTSLKTAKALAVIDRLAEIGVYFIAFSGGEPLVRKDIFQLMAHCRKHQLDIGLRANGVLITTGVARQLAKLKLAVAGISLDGATAPTHDQIRGKGTFLKTIAGIKELLAADIRVNIEAVLSHRNASDSLQFVQLAEELGVQEINFSAIAPQGRAEQLMNRDMLDNPLWQELTTTLHRVSLTAKVAVSPSCALTGRCGACIEPNITCDGWVTSCYLSKSKLFHILDTPPKEIKARLRQNRLAMLNICGRTRWIQPSNSLQQVLHQKKHT